MGEPWVISPPGLTIEDVKGVWNAGGEHIATFHDADARRRALACVNALEGWTTEALEQLAAPLADQLRERDERIRKLEDALQAARDTHGELCSDWDNCEFIKLLDELLGEG